MANGKKELIENISDIRRLAGLAEAPRKKAAAPSNPDPNNYGSFSTNNNSPYGFARGGSDDDTAANFFASDKRMRDAQQAQQTPQAAAPKPAAPKPAAPAANTDAIKAFQRSKGLTPDGIVGPRTRAAGWGNTASPEIPTARYDMPDNPTDTEKALQYPQGGPPQAKTSPQGPIYNPPAVPGIDTAPKGRYQDFGRDVGKPPVAPAAPAPAPKVEPAPSRSAAPSDTPPQAAPITRQPEMFTDPDKSRNIPGKVPQPLPPLPAPPPATPAPDSGFRNLPLNIPPGSGLERQLQQLPTQPAQPAKPANPWNNRTFQPSDQPVSPPTGSFTKPPGNDASSGSNRTGGDIGRSEIQYADARPSIFPHQVIKELEDMINDGEEIEEEVVDTEIEECGDMMSPQDTMSHHNEQEANINITSNFDSKSGRKSLTVSAEGEAAEELAQILKMAGLR